MYHHVSPVVAHGPYARVLTVTPADFRSQLAWLHAHGCRVVLVDTIYRDAVAGSLAPCETALTFDDGYDDAPKFALPALRSYGFTATFYITTAFVGMPGHLTLEQLRALLSAGMQIGAHTVHHLDLSKLPPARAAHEIDASATSLREWLRTPVTSFAYPAGKFSPVVVADVRAASFDNAVGTQPGNVTAISSRYELPRYRIERGDGLRLYQAVFGHGPAEDTLSASELAHIARRRIEGNDPALAEGIAVALLAGGFPEQVLKVHVLSFRPATVAGIVLSGVKFHRKRNRAQFEADVKRMLALAFAAAPQATEIDVWATVPLDARAGAPVSGDYAVPTSTTVFSAAVTKSQWDGRNSGADLGKTYWDPHFLR